MCTGDDNWGHTATTTKPVPHTASGPPAKQPPSCREAHVGSGRRMGGVAGLVCCFNNTARTSMSSPSLQTLMILPYPPRSASVLLVEMTQNERERFR